MPIQILPIVIICALLLLFMLLYLRLARHFGIVDKPNSRSSHTKVTIRGGGVIFVLAMLLWWFTASFILPLFMIGFLLISLVSFLDDLGHVPNLLRILIHGLAFSLLWFAAGITPEYSALAYGLLFVASAILSLGFFNAYNFMDGINGITIAYSAATMGTLSWLNQEYQFIDSDIFLYILCSLAVFAIFNFRSRAICFAGDVGAVSLAFVTTFLLMLLIWKTGNPWFIILLLVYGIDAVGTIIQRLIRKENIFEAHRSHLYQLMANESGWSHLQVSALYGAVQLAINLLFIYSLHDPQLLRIVFFGLILLASAIYAAVKLGYYKVLRKA